MAWSNVDIIDIGVDFIFIGTPNIIQIWAKVLDNKCLHSSTSP